MALFTDGPPATVGDLVALDAQVLNVANAEGIDITQKLALAHEELALELSAQFTQSNNCEEWLWASQPPRLNMIVVTRALKLWHTYRSLEMVYRDAYSSQLNDRYAGKRDQFHQMANWAYEQLALIGIGVVQTPIPKAQTASAVPVQSASGDVADGTYYLSISWVNAAGEEGVASDATAVTIAGSTFLVTTGPAPKGATGWNVYVGTDPTAVTLQNSGAIETGASWIQPSAITMTGRQPGCGQEPNYERALPRVIQRG